MNKYKSFVRQYKSDFFALIINIIVAYFSFGLTNPKIAFTATIGVFVVSMAILIYIKTKDKDFYFLPLDRPGLDSDWVGRGTFKFIRNEQCYEITASDIGFIYPKMALWDDYKMECEFKIVHASIGVIFRAANLSNSVMIQVFSDKVKSHVRINGDWIVYGEEKITTPLTSDNWYRIKAYCEKRKIRIVVISDRKEIVNRHITIPDNINVVYKRAEKQSEGDDKPLKLIQNVELDFGAIGFRNSGRESALVKNVYVEKL